MYSIDRRAAILLSGLLALITLAGCGRALSAPRVNAAAEWPMEGHGPARDRETAESLTLPLNTSGKYTLAGTADYASPVAIAGGLLFAESDNKLHALALTDGKEQWQINLAGSYLSPAVAAGTVFVRAESGENGFIVALRADTGSKLWQYQFARVGSSYDNVGGHVTSPVMVDGLVLVGASEMFYALDASSGKVVWSYNTEYPVVSSASIADGVVYIGDFTRLYALDLKTGVERWRFDHGKLSLYFAPIIFDDQVAIAGFDTIYVLDRASGAERWSKRFADTEVIPAGASHSQLYVKATNQLWALNPDNGTVAWNYATTNFVSLPAITNDQLYVVTRSDGGSQVRALNQRDGKELWRQDQADLLNTAPVVAGGRLYVRISGGAVLFYASS